MGSIVCGRECERIYESMYGRGGGRDIVRIRAVSIYR